MIHKHKQVLLILSFILLINFITLPKHESESASLSIGAIYGTAKATKLLLFLYSCLAAGVTFNAVKDAEKAFEKWYDDYVQYYDNTQIEPSSNLPDPRNNKDWKDIFSELAHGLTLGYGLSETIKNLKDWFQSLGAQEGENNFGDIGDRYFNGAWYSYRIVFQNGNEEIYLTVNGHEKLIVKVGNRDNSVSSITVSLTNYEDGIVYYTINYIAQESTGPSLKTHSSYTSFSINEDYVPIVGNAFNYTVKPNSPIITNSYPNIIAQPDIGILPLETQVTPEGEEKFIYPGTMEDLVDEYVDTVTWEDLLAQGQPTAVKKPYTLTETQSGVEVNYDEKTGTIPTPFPNPDSTPIEDVAEFQGKNIGLLQSIINWLKLIYDKLANLPKTLGDLFIPAPDYLSKKIMNIKNILGTRLGEYDPNIIDGYFSGLQCRPIPDGYIYGSKVFDASYVNNLAPMIANWQRWFWYVLLTLAGLNNTYKLIRGTNLINLGSYDLGSGSGGTSIEVKK